MYACKASDPTSNFLKDHNNIKGISIDDRTINKGDLFIALIGDKFDGHNFIEAAISKGACGVLVSNIRVAKKYNGLFVDNTKFIEKLMKHKLLAIKAEENVIRLFPPLTINNNEILSTPK